MSNETVKNQLAETECAESRQLADEKEMLIETRASEGNLFWLHRTDGCIDQSQLEIIRVSEQLMLPEKLFRLMVNMCKEGRLLYLLLICVEFPLYLPIHHF